MNLKTLIFALAKNFSSPCPSLLGQKFFVPFLEEMKTQKNPFEINSPLATTFIFVEKIRRFVITEFV